MDLQNKYNTITNLLKIAFKTFLKRSINTKTQSEDKKNLCYSVFFKTIFEAISGV